MITWTQIENAIVAEIRAATNLRDGHIILGQQDVQPPTSGEYIVVTFGNARSVGRDQEGPVNEEGMVELIGSREITISVDAFRGTARELCEAVVTAMHKTSVLERLAVAGVAVYDVGPGQNVTVPEGGKWVPHWAAEIFIRVASSDTDDVGLIESVELERTTVSPPGANVTDEFVVEASE